MEALTNVKNLLEAGQKPSYEDLEAGLVQAIEDRNHFEKVLREISRWMAAIVSLHMAKDAIAVKQALDSFVDEHVTVTGRSNQNGSVH